MKKLGKSLLTAILATTTVLPPDCSEKIAGAGSETTNGISGRVINRDGTPAANTVVKLFPSAFDPVADTGIGYPLIDTTDSNGHFIFRNLDTGSYCIMARNDTHKSGMTVQNISVCGLDSVTSLSPLKLAGLGSVEADFSGAADNASGYIYIPGTDLFSVVNADSALLYDVPSCTLQSLIYARSDGEKRNILRRSVFLPPESLLTIRYAAWKYSRRIILNTSSEGAGITGDIYDFPVLIRLDNSNFDFSEADSLGNDLLFTGSNGKPLGSEIERWNYEEKKAEIWVLIDTIKGNNDSQSITMYWGGGRFASVNSVFDTAKGFQGVWHFSDEEKDLAADATPNKFNAVSSDPASTPLITEGIIGDCRLFNGSNSFLTAPNSANGKLNFPQNGCFSVSAWVYIESADAHSHVIVSKGNMQYFLWHTPIHLNSTLWEFANYRNGSGWDLSVSPVTTGEWVLLTGVREGTTQYLYVNGILSDTLIDYPFSTPRNTSSDLMIGRFAQIMASPNNDEGYCYFKGRIDELRIYSRPLDADWIRLCYLNQRRDDKLVVFR